MSQGILKNVYKAFNRSASKIYLRTSEINQIKSFLKNKNNILHICGNPGIGKTVTIKHVLKNTKHTFYNFLENENINYQQAKHKIIVIDEFDKFYSQKPIECKKLFLFVSQKNKKLITISNSLNIFEDILYFTSYSTDDLIYIIKSKLEELKGIAMDDQVLKYIIVKMGKGDLRRIFDSCKCAIEQCLENGRLTVEMADVVNNKENHEENGLNHKIVKEIVSNGCKGDKKSVYEKYAAICKESNVPPLSRTDFFLLYDMYKEM